MRIEVEKTCSSGLLAALMVALLAVSGCSFESGLGDVTCDQEGAESDGRVCRNGYWQPADIGVGLEDTMQSDVGDGGEADADTTVVPDGCVPAEETCNGGDDDCDGVVDEGCSCPLASEKGVCSQGGTKQEDGSCRPPSVYVDEESAQDCDGRDNDCDGDVDEACPCESGETQSCYDGASGTAGVGRCKTGTQTCQPDGTFGACEGAVLPAEETCGDDVDSDCNGATDNGCACDYKGNEEGVCGGLTRDEEGKCPEPEDWESPTASESKCDQKDNDCDGVVDEGCPCAYKNKTDGICKMQTRDARGKCPEPTDYEDPTDQEGACAGKDNDCDGTVDEGCGCTSGDTGSCYSGPSGTKGIGACTAGTRTCQSDGTWGSCSGEVTPRKETCGDNVDADCNGVKDNGCTCDYQSKSDGVCQGQVIDTMGKCTKPADYEAPTDTETHCDNKDNDCDGYVDEGCPCDYKGRSDGICQGLTRDKMGQCPKPKGYVDSLMSEKPECDGSTDNNCNGTVDEGCQCTNSQTVSCYTGPSGTKNVGECQAGTQTCSGGTLSSCMGEVTPVSEQCGDSKDSDCNGVDDNGCPCDYNSNSTGVCGKATKGSMGQCQQPSGYESAETSCSDNVDNDCDGSTDGNDPDCQSGTNKTAGVSCTNDSECLSGDCINPPLAGGRCAQTIVVTSKTWDGKLGGVAGADQKCQNLLGPKFGGTWQAVISEQSSWAVSRITISGPLYNTNGDKVADSGFDFWDGSQDHPVEYDELGNSLSGSNSVYIWAATHRNGTWDGRREGNPAEDCKGWTSNSSSELAEVGESDESGTEWIITAGPDGSDELKCNKQAALYCVDGQ